MRRLLKILLWSGGVTALLGIALLVALVTVDPNEYKGHVAALLSSQLGRDVTLDGDLAVTFYPWLGLEVGGVSVGNAEGFGPEPFLSADRVKLRARTLPLLRNHYELDVVRVKGAIINLVRDARGRSNWDDLKDADADPSGAIGLPLAGIVLGGLAIQDARVTWADEQAGTRYLVSDLNASSAELRYGEPVSVRSGFRARSEQPPLSAEVELEGVINYATDASRYTIAPLAARAVIEGEDVPGGIAEATFSMGVRVDADAQTLALTDLDLNALGVTMQGEVRASEIDSSEPGVSAALELRGADLGLPFRVAGIEPLASRLAEAAPRGFMLDAELDADLKRGDIDVSTLSAQLLGAAFNGQLKARNIRSDTPAVQGSLSATGPDLPTLLWTLGQFQGDADARLAGYGALLAGTPAKAFRLETAFDADLKSGDVTVSELSLDALGITASGSLEASNMRSRKGAVRGSLALRARRPVALLRVLDQPGLEQALQSATLDAELQGTGEAINLEPLSLELTLNDARVAGGAARLRLDADARVEPDKGVLRFGRFDLRGLGLQTTGHAVVRDVFGEPDYSGQLRMPSVDLRELTQRLGWPMPTGADPDAFARVALDTRFAGTATELDLNKLQLQLDDSRLNGDLMLRAAPASPALEFKLELDEIDLDRYLPARADDADDSRPLVLPVDTLRALTMDGALKIGKLAVSDVALRQATLRLSAKSGALRADPLAATLYDGRFEGALTLDVNPDLPRLAVNSTLQGVQIGPLLKDIHGKAVLLGAGDLTTNLLTSGADSEQLKRNLHGHMGVYLREGAIAGINLGRTLRAWKQYKKGGLMELQETETSDFSELTGNIVITDGVMRMDDLSVKAPAFRLRGSGVLANLRADTIDYRTLVAVVNTARGVGGRELAELEGLELPVNITGALDNPKVALDWGGLLGPIIVEGLLDALNVPTAPANRPAEDEPPGSEDTDRQPNLEDLPRELLKEGLKKILGR